MSASVAPRPTTAATGVGTGESPNRAEFSWRVLRLLNAFRFSIALILLLIFIFVRDPRIVGEIEPGLAGLTLWFLLSFTVVQHWLLKRRWLGVLPQVYVQFGLDLITIILLMHASGGVASGLGGLLVVSVGTLSLLVALERALLLASLTTFVLLAEQTLAVARGITDLTEFGATGILGAVIFVITGIVQLVRDRIVATEALAEQRGVDLQNLVELNDYVIQHLRESIVVVDGDNEIRLLNESASGLLGVSGIPQGKSLREVAPVLCERLDRWREGAEPAVNETFAMEHDQSGTNIQPHFVQLGSNRREGVVLFLEDTSLIFERVQQTKLAALGRLSASIAHEIRNPLGALSHATQLLAESSNLDREDHRLTDIIRVNSDRVSHIVENVLSLSKSDRTRPQRIELKSWLRDFAEEFTKTQELYEGTISLSSSACETEAEMDRTHLHQILWNLCENAVKYASAAAGAIAVELNCGLLEGSKRPYVDVMDSGPGIDPEKVEQIFEPFYTAQPGGTGLGLYISRELCDRNSAGLRYHPRHSGGSVFRITFADPSRWQSSGKR